MNLLYRRIRIVRFLFLLYFVIYDMVEAIRILEDRTYILENHILLEHFLVYENIEP